jgi:hypothetical protein
MDLKLTNHGSIFLLTPVDHGGSSTNTRVSNHRLTVGPLAPELSAKVPRNLDKSVRWVEEK